MARHKKELGVQTDIFFFQWLQCGFLSVLPLEVATAIWDLFLIDGTVVFYRVALAIFTMLRGELVKADYENFIKIITCHADKRGLWKDVMDEKTLLSAAEGLTSGLCSGVGVAVTSGVAVAVGVGSGVAVAVGVGVGVGVGAGVGVGWADGLGVGVTGAVPWTTSTGQES